MRAMTNAVRVTVIAVAATAITSQTATAASDQTIARPSSSTSLARRLQQMELRWKQMEADRKQMEAEMQTLRAEMARFKSETSTQAQATDDKLTAKQAAVEEELQAHQNEKNHRVFFRGGYVNWQNSRANQAFTDMYARDNNRQYGPQNLENDGVYLGAGAELSVSDNLFGLMDDTEFMTEFMFDWNRNDSHEGGKTAIGTTNGAAAVVPQIAYKTGLNPQGRHLRGVTLSQYTFAASPKIKFFKGNAFRPWLIPAGLTLNVISPPSDAATSVGPGVMFAVGFEYNFWRNLILGMDGRYNWVANEFDSVRASYFQMGGYLGAGF